MKLLDRHFLKQFLKPFGVCLIAFLLCMVVYDLYDNIHDFIEAKASLGKILYYYFILLPAWIVQIMPITLLLSLLYVLSDMSKHGELTAMRASGLDFFRLMGPYFLIGICLSIQILVLNLLWAPNALYKAKVVFEKTTRQEQDSKAIAFKITYRHLAGNRFWYVSALDVQQRQATGIVIVQSDSHQQDLQRISAMSGFYQDGHWTFENVVVNNCLLPISDPNNLQRYPLLEARNFTESPQELLTEFKKTKRMTTQELLEKLRYSERLSPKQYSIFSTEFYSRISFPISNLVVSLIGIPFGVVAQRRSTFLAIVNALLFFFGYMLISQLFLILGQSGRISGWLAAWIPNFLFMAVGIFMIRKIR